MSHFGREQVRTTFTVPAGAGSYAPERLTFGLAFEGIIQEAYQSLAILVEGGTAAPALVELWLPKDGARPDAAGAPEDADYVFSGQVMASGLLVLPLAGYFGAQLRVKSVGVAGTVIVSMTASKAPAAQFRAASDTILPASSTFRDPQPVVGATLFPGVSYTNAQTFDAIVPVAGAAKVRFRWLFATAGGTLSFAYLRPVPAQTAYTTGNPPNATVTAGAEGTVTIEPVGEAWVRVRFTAGGTGTCTFLDVSQL
jgi:hypothetical protein